MEEIIEYDARVLTPVQGQTSEQVVEIDDQTIENDIRRNMSEYQRLQMENSRILQEVSSLRAQAGGFTASGFGRVEEEYLQLKSRISELESRHSVVDQDRDRLFKKSQTTTHMTNRTHVQVTVEDPQVEVLRRELKGLISENRGLVDQIRRFRVTQTHY
jgi:chromosome segregation ATPase